MEKFERWKVGMESKGLRVNTKKTKVLVSGCDIGPVSVSGRWPCSVYGNGVGSNSIFCGFCKHWVHKKCSGVKGRLRPIADFKCRCCTGDARPLDGRPVKSIAIGGETLEVVDKFCYLGDMISVGGGAGESSVSRIRSG